jgi:P27 family predicted phage terminase small subunit
MAARQFLADRNLGGMDVPEGLDEAGKDFWAAVDARYDLDPGEVVLLERACRTLDVLAGIDDWLADHGLVVTGSTGQVRAHPLLTVRNEQERTLVALITALGLPSEEDRDRQQPWRERRRAPV